MYIIKVYKGENTIQTERYSDIYNFTSQASIYKRLLRNVPERCGFDRVEGFYSSTCGTPTTRREFLYTV